MSEIEKKETDFDLRAFFNSKKGKEILEQSEKDLKALFEFRNIQKKYLALVHGKFKEEMIIEKPANSGVINLHFLRKNGSLNSQIFR